MEEPGEFIEEAKPVNNSISPLFGVILFMLMILPFGGFLLGQQSVSTKQIEVTNEEVIDENPKTLVGYGIYLFGDDVYTYSSVSVPGDEELKKVIEGVDSDTFVPVPEFAVGETVRPAFSPLADGGYYPRWYQDKENFYCVEGKGVRTAILKRPVKFEFTGATQDVEEVLNRDVGYKVWIENETRTFGQLRFVEESTGKVYDTDCNVVIGNDLAKFDESPVYTIQTYRDSDGWEGAWLLKEDNQSDGLEKVFKLSEDFVSFEALASDNLLYLSSGEYLLVVDIESRKVKKYPVGKSIQDMLVVGDSVIVQTLSTEVCADLPDSYNKCTSSYSLVDLGSGEVTLVADVLPGAKGLVAYTPDTDLVIRNGYGDAGCQSSIFHRINLDSSESVEDLSVFYCSGDTGTDYLTYEEYTQAVDDYFDSLTESSSYSKTDVIAYETWVLTDNMVVGVSEYERNRNVGEGVYVVPVFIPSENKLLDLTTYTDEVVGIQFSYPSEWGVVTVNDEKGSCDSSYTDDDCNFRTYLFSDLGEASVFMVAETSGHHLNPVGRDAFWGDQAGSVGKTYATDCEKDQSCSLVENSNGLVLSKYDSDPMTAGGIGYIPERYYLYNPNSEYYGIILSDSRIKSEEITPEFFKQTVIDSLTFVPNDN